MFYKLEYGVWISGNTIHFPDGTVLSNDNRISKDGWVWMDSPPEDFENQDIFVNS